jgi:Putative peptidoglycan binding domain
MTADRGPRRPGARLRVVALPVLAAGLTAGALTGGYALHSARQPSAPGTATGTASAVRTDIINTVQVSGSLSYGGLYTVINETPGTAYTALPAPGAVIGRGQRLYEVDGTPVTLFYGARPEWRMLTEGVTPGPDVAQLDRNLIALGFGAYLTISDNYTAATAYAVELWQQAAGLLVTGTVPLGQIAFAPGELRVAGVTPGVGSPPQPGAAVLTATSPVAVVTAQLPVSQEYLVHAGDHVTVTMPDGVTTTPGVVTAVSSVATAGNGGQGNGGQGNGGQPQPGASQGAAGGSGTSQDTVALTVRLIHPGTAGNLDEAPVNVNIVSAQVRDVLAVPISALVALAGGGYAVEVVHGSGASATRHLVPVQTGLYSDTLVQVSGASLTAGEEVEVPSS